MQEKFRFRYHRTGENVNENRYNRKLTIVEFLKAWKIDTVFPDNENIGSEQSHERYDVLAAHTGSADADEGRDLPENAARTSVLPSTMHTTMS